jgi:hypothetical protein
MRQAPCTRFRTAKSILRAIFTPSLRVASPPRASGRRWARSSAPNSSVEFGGDPAPSATRLGPPRCCYAQTASSSLRIASVPFAGRSVPHSATVRRAKAQSAKAFARAFHGTKAASGVLPEVFRVGNHGGSGCLSDHCVNGSQRGEVYGLTISGSRNQVRRGVSDYVGAANPFALPRNYPESRLVGLAPARGAPTRIRAAGASASEAYHPIISTNAIPQSLL